MVLPDGYMYTEIVEPTVSNATEIQRLTLQDVTAGEFPNPKQIADPDDPDKVSFTFANLTKNPQAYHAVYQDGRMVAYVKWGYWKTGDELSFATGLRKLVLQIRRLLGRTSNQKHWGIFGLVASDALSKDDRDAILDHLLEQVHVHLLAQAFGSRWRLFIVLHDHDPVTPIVEKHDFRRVGKPGPAAGVPGLEGLDQRLYRL